MDFSILASLLEGVKELPEYLSAIVIAAALIFSFMFKSKSQDHQQVTEVSKLQTEQLKVLIEQNDKLLKINSELSQQVHSLRSELSEAYTRIDHLQHRLEVLQREMRKQ